MTDRQTTEDKRTDDDITFTFAKNPTNEREVIYEKSIQLNTEKCPQHFQTLREIPGKFSDFMKRPSETVISRNDRKL